MHDGSRGKRAPGGIAFVEGASVARVKDEPKGLHLETDYFPYAMATGITRESSHLAIPTDKSSHIGGGKPTNTRPAAASHGRLFPKPLTQIEGEFDAPVTRGLPSLAAT